MALSKIKKCFEIYKEEIICNPTLASDIECGIKCVSFLLSGHFKNSNLVSEFIFSCSQLLSLTNDFFLKNALNIRHSVDKIILKLQSFINIIEYLQVFFEFSGEKFGGVKGKWIIITIIQFIKSSIKLLLLLKYKQGLQKRFPIFSLDRKKIMIDFVNSGKLINEPLNNSRKIYNYYNSINLDKCNVFKSGHIMRKIDFSPSVRDWTLPRNTSFYKHLVETRINIPSTKLNDIQILSEISYILKPLVHLSSLGYFGKASWYPFLISLSMDTFNVLVLTSTEKRLNRCEVNEIYIRKINLLFYILKSPMFDNHTKFLLMSVIQKTSSNIPLIGKLLLPLINYVNAWQSIYFHLN